MTQPPPPPPGYPPQQPPAGQAPNNYLVWSILATLFCCLLTGIVAIVKVRTVNGLWAQGQHAEAQAAADQCQEVGDLVGHHLGRLRCHPHHHLGGRSV